MAPLALGGENDGFSPVDLGGVGTVENRDGAARLADVMLLTYFVGTKLGGVVSRDRGNPGDVVCLECFGDRHFCGSREVQTLRDLRADRVVLVRRNGDGSQDADDRDGRSSARSG